MHCNQRHQVCVLQSHSGKLKHRYLAKPAVAGFFFARFHQSKGYGCACFHPLTRYAPNSVQENGVKTIVNRTVFRQQSGFIASYILYGIGLLAIVGAAYARLNTNAQQGQSVQDTVSEVAVQLEVIKGKIMLCAAVYPDGDHGQFDTRHAYPAPATTGNIAVISAVMCPTPNGPLPLALMPDGIPLPVSPPDFEEWVYEHTEAGGIRLRLIPRVSAGASPTRERLLRQYEGSIIANGDELVFAVLN
jgi:hypothetical protein